MPEPSKSDSECIAGLELPKQDNAHAPHPVSAAIIYAGVFTMTCALYSSILSACWGFLLIILPGYANRSLHSPATDTKNQRLMESLVACRHHRAHLRDDTSKHGSLANAHTSQSHPMV